MHHGQIFTPAQLRVGRRPALLPCDRARVEETLRSAPSLSAAAVQLGVCRRLLHYFLAVHTDLREHVKVRRRGRPQPLSERVDLVRATLAASPSLIAAARALQVGRRYLRDFALEHGLSWLDGRRRR